MKSSFFGGIKGHYINTAIGWCHINWHGTIEIVEIYIIASDINVGIDSIADDFQARTIDIDSL